jgi:hypothetical protein
MKVRITEEGFLLAVGVYVLSAVLGWALVGVLVALWWRS